MKKELDDLYNALQDAAALTATTIPPFPGWKPSAHKCNEKLGWDKDGKCLWCGKKKS